MITILEGVNGTGKSTYAAMLATYMEAAVLRPFRQGPRHHFTGGTAIERSLKSFGVPYNTHVDELYTADTLGRLLRAEQPITVVLDRSVGSSLAYGDRPIGDAGRLIELWSGLLGRNAQVLYVWLTAPPDVAAERLRLDGRPADADHSQVHARLHRSYELVYQMIPYEKMVIDTSKTQVNEGVTKVIKEYERIVGKTH